MKKAYRDIARMAEREGIDHPRVEGGSPHGRLIGYVGGRPISLVISATKWDKARCLMSTKLNIRREVRRLREGAGA